MVKTRNPKNPEHRYFSVNAIAELDEASAPFEGYVTAYANYVIHRTKHFTARYCDTACTYLSRSKYLYA
jgi:NADH:ubiquinone oxidoreductase subunit E